jgi:sec-independent protein translocase protein TatA
MGSLGPTEIILIVLVLVLLFGAKKLPELARGSGRALRIFKAETKGLMDDEDDQKTEAQRQIDSQRVDPMRPDTPPAVREDEHEVRPHGDPAPYRDTDR